MTVVAVVNMGVGMGIVVVGLEVITDGIGVMEIRIERSGHESGMERRGTSWAGETGGVLPRAKLSSSESELELLLGG